MKMTRGKTLREVTLVLKCSSSYYFLRKSVTLIQHPPKSLKKKELNETVKYDPNYLEPLEGLVDLYRMQAQRN